MITAITIAAALSAGAQGPVVLRGQTAPDPRPVARVGPEGVTLAPPEDLNHETVAWDRVKLVIGPEASQSQPFIATGQTIWRARQRLLRGDVVLAEPLVLEAQHAYEDLAPAGPTQANVCALAALLAIARGEPHNAVESVLRLHAMRAQGWRAAPDLEAALRLDPSTGLCPDVPPFWIDQAAARRAAHTLLTSVSLNAQAGEGGYFDWYLYAAQSCTGDAADAGATPPQTPESALRDDPVLALVRAAVLSDHDTAEQARADARQELARLAAQHAGTWREAWARFALGRSLLHEESPDARVRGVLELLHVPARFQSQFPVLSLAALERSARELVAQGMNEASAALAPRLSEARALASGALVQPALAPSAPVPQNEDPAATAASDAAPSPDEALERYLEASKLVDLQALLLEERLTRSGGVERADVARRLAAVLVDVLDRADPARRAQIEERATRLLSELPDADAVDLRLTLSRSAYLRAEETAERWRLRLVPDSQAQACRTAMTGLYERFSDLASQAGTRVDQLEKQEESMAESQGRDAVMGLLNSARRTRSMAHFFAGWCAYYSGELGPPANRDVAGLSAQRHFGRLLNARGDEPPSLDRLPAQLLEYEHVARAALGTALAASLRGNETEALRWLEAIDRAPNVSPAIREQLRSRRLIVFARAARWDDIAAEVSTGAASASAAESRLLAALCLEADDTANSQTRRSLIEGALTRLASQGETGQVLDLSTRYFDTLAKLCGEGFMIAYARGLRDFERARAMLPPGASLDSPVADRATLDAFASSAAFLRTALGASDISRFRPALGAASLLLARASFLSANDAASLAQSAELFVDASESLAQTDAVRASAALVAGMRALELSLKAKPDASITRRREELAALLAARDPGHPAAAAYVYERATSGKLPPKEAARMLLAVPESSPVAELARYHASRLLYEQWKQASADEQPAAATEFLNTAVPIVESARRGAPEAGPEWAQRTVLTARRVLDCLLAGQDAPRAAQAHAAADLIASLMARGLVDAAALEGELAFRRVQLALLSQDLDAARRAASACLEADQRLGEAALRLLYQHAANEFSAAPEDSEPRLRAAASVVETGRLVLKQFPPESANAADPGVATLYHTIAQACTLLWATKHDEGAKVLAGQLFEKLLAAHSNVAEYLRSYALFEITRGSLATSLSAWRSLAAGLPSGSPEWYEARYWVIEILAGLDPAAAQEQMRQHEILSPTLGPPPWDVRFADLKQRMSGEQARRENWDNTAPGESAPEVPPVPAEATP